MISNWVIQAFANFVAFFLDKLPGFVVPQWVLDVPGYADEVNDYMADMGAWVNFQAMTYALLGIMVCIVFAVSLRTWRIVASFFTAGGGQ